MQPLKFLWGLFKVIANHMFWLYLSILIDNTQAYDQGEDLDDLMDYPDPTQPGSKLKEQEFDRRVLITRTKPERCDKSFTLYELTRPMKEKKSEYELTATCKRPFVVIPIPSTNLLLYVGNILCYKRSLDDYGPLSNQPIEVYYNETLHCKKLRNVPPYRRNLKDCFSQHVNESQIELCGHATRFRIHPLVSFMISLFIVIFSRFYLN